MPRAGASHDDDDRSANLGHQDRVDPRVAQTRSRVIAATRRVIAEAGITGASVERIAARSGVARSTIYRRWPDLNALYADALLSADPAGHHPVTPTGDIRTDLRRFLTEHADRLNDPGHFTLLLSMVLLAARDSRVAGVHRRKVGEAASGALRIIEAGQRSGALRPDLDRAHALVLLLGPGLYVRMMEQRRITPSSIDLTVDEFLQRFGT